MHLFIHTDKNKVFQMCQTDKRLLNSLLSDDAD